MAQIQQIQLRFEPQEDRLLLRLGTNDQNEYRFWLTRRYVRLLWPVLLQLLAKTAGAAAVSDEAARRAVLSFRHEEAVHQSDFDTPFEERSRNMPLGEVPALLSRVQLKSEPNGTAVLALHPQEGQGVDISMTESLLHGFCKLLADAVTKAEWGIDCRITAPGAAPVASRSSVN